MRQKIILRRKGIMMKRFALIGLLMLGACTDQKGATHALQAAGLKPVKVGGYGFLACDGKSDTFATKFTAVNSQGQTVTGTVCGGWWKGKTIRYD
jgi:hypothetical protein